MIIPLADIKRIVVFVHKGQLKLGNICLVTIHDGVDDFAAQLENWQSYGAICVYDGPPVPPVPVAEGQ